MNCTNLEAVDVSIDEGASRILSTSPQNSEQEIIEATVEENRNQESIYNKTLEKGREKKREKEDITGENHLTTGDLRVPEINSPADIYKYFPRIVGFEDELAETESSSSKEIGSRENNSDSDGQLSDDYKVRSPSNTKTGTSIRGKTVKKCLIKKHLRKQQLNC